METLIILIMGIVVGFYMGKRAGSADPAEIKVTYENFGPGDYQEDDEDRDSWEGGFWEASDPKKLSAYIEIEYIDGNDSITKRAVRVREFDNELYGGIIMGRCELRNATRTFRFDRVRKCVDLETGEVVRDVKQYLNDLYDKSPEKSAEILADDYIDILKVIFFVAKADGQYRKEEKEVVSNYVRVLVRDDRITTKMIDQILNEMDVPSMQGFKMALGRVLKSGEVNPEQLATCCKEIVDTQKSVHPMEKEALQYIEKNLSSL